MNLAEHPWTDLADADPDVVLVPVGSIEQHGPHAPLGTDQYLAEAVADRGASESDRAVVVCPSLPIGISAEHRQFAGTLWLTPDTFRRVVRETIESLAAHGWTRVVVVNGHGGNVPALGEVCAAVSRTGETYCVPFTWFDAVDLSPDRMGHAGAVETSALLSLNPDLVREDRLEDVSEEAAERWGTWVRGINLSYDSIEFTKNGVVGTPDIATRDRGEELLDEAGNALSEVIDAVLSQG